MKYSKAEKYLFEADPRLGELIKQQFPLIIRPKREDYFESLARSIVGQQISVLAATKIFERLTAITNLDPHKITELTDSDSAKIGLSGQKRRYLTDLARHFVLDPKVFNHLEKLSDEEVITELTAVSGIGVWTSQMFLIFTLDRPDIFAVDDRGLQVAIQNLYGQDKGLTKLEMNTLSQKWSPQRTLASLYLWQSLRNTPGAA